MRIDLKTAAEKLLKKDNIVILTHSSPDGDTLGCAFALKKGLLQKGIKSAVLCSDNIPKKYSYMFEDIENSPMDEAEFVVAVDIADIILVGDEIKKEYSGRIDMAFDHHALNRLECKELYLDSGAAAAAEIIYDLLLLMNVTIDKGIADCLYTGISTDTGCFRYSNVTSRTHRIAAELIEAGADYANINKLMFDTKTKTYMHLEKLVTDTMEMHFDDRCLIETLTYDMYEKSGSDESETEPLAPRTRQVEGVEVGALLREKADGTVKVSMRTNGNLDASAICSKLGGGGHPNASGCQLDGPVESAKAKLLETIGEFLS